MIRCPICLEELVVEDLNEVKFYEGKVFAIWEGCCASSGKIFQ